MEFHGLLLRGGSGRGWGVVGFGVHDVLAMIERTHVAIGVRDTRAGLRLGFTQCLRCLAVIGRHLAMLFGVCLVALGGVHDRRPARNLWIAAGLLQRRCIRAVGVRVRGGGLVLLR